LKFSELDLDPDLLYGIETLGFENTTPIQEQAIPRILADKDLIACAQTGTGKTGAYLIPTIDRLSQTASGHTRALILAPTRELALQIDQNIEALSYFAGVSSVSVVGGKNPKDFERQKFALENGADIIVATPGRLMVYQSLGTLDFSQIEVVILDEADKMLDMGFYGDIIKIISGVPKERQTLMFSATMPNKIRKLAREILVEPEEINLNLAKPAEGINQMAYSVYDNQKIPLLEQILSTREVETMIIFASSKASVDNIHRKLNSLGYDAEAMHSDKSQDERQTTLRRFKNREFRIIIGTDVLARGIDIDNLSHVLNFDVPHDAEDYVHRVGRTARANTTGEAITFINPKDQFKFSRIEELIETEVPKPGVPEELGETPEYAPRRRGGRGEKRGGGNRGGGNRGGGNRGGGGNRHRGGNGGGGRGRGRGGNGGGRNRNRDQQNRREDGDAQKRNDRPANSDGNQGDKPKKRRNRGGRNRRRKPGGDSQGGQNPTPPASQE